MIRKIIPYLLTLVLVGAGAVYFGRNYRQFSQITISSVPSLAGLIVCCAALYVLNGLIFKILLQIFGIRLKFREAIGLSFITSIGNYLVPYVGGIGLRASYLKKRYNFSLGLFMGTVAAGTLFSVITNAVMGITALLYVFLVHRIFSWPILVVFTALIAAGSVILAIPYKPADSDNIVLSRLNKVITGWRTIADRKKECGLLVAVIVGVTLTSVLTLYFAFRSFSGGINLPEAAVISAMDSVTVLISVTPQRLGISEGMVIFVSRVFGYLPALSLTAAVLRRVILLLMAIIGGTVSSFYLSRLAFRERDT